MTFKKYITYSEYKELGGALTEADFDKQLFKAQKILDSFTYDRIPQLLEIPIEVKQVVALFIDSPALLEMSDNISSYSNGVESFSYGEGLASAINKGLYSIVLSFLPPYLTNRRLEFDVTEYI